jgi:hypothetical protein
VGSGVRHHVEGKNEGGVRGSATWTGTARTRQLWAALIAAGSTRLTGAAGMGYEQGRTAVCATQNGMADRWGWATSGPGGSGRGTGGSASEQDSVARGADWRAWQHSTARFGFKPVQTDSKFLKL